MTKESLSFAVDLETCCVFAPSFQMPCVQEWLFDNIIDGVGGRGEDESAVFVSGVDGRQFFAGSTYWIDL